MQYIIDGCNVTHHPKFIRAIPKRSADTRFSLVELIKSRGLCGNANNLVWLIFDGYPDHLIEGLEKGRLRIIFSYNRSADDKIKRLLELIDRPRDAVVVSDDKEVSSFARLMHARSMSIEDFIKDDVSGKRIKVRPDEIKVNYSQMQKIDEELKRIWLR
ncbi:MAG: NYN domain-containing protein [Candidatus Omnitrophica bacterium]|nr:NYN domain-containing protein [Candidatus Omnitrophota bacterium]